MQFEGPEKKLEIILKKSRNDIRRNKEFWKDVLQAARVGIIGCVQNENLDAYLLSESSLFVYDDKIIAITCGKSKLYLAVPEILKRIDASEIEYLFYERKNFIYPEAQLSRFDLETSEISRVFPGQRVVFGPHTSDHVYLYFSGPEERKKNERKSGKQEFSSNKRPDTTLEILMHEISWESARIFYAGDAKSSEQARSLSGIDRLLPDVPVSYSDHLFEPCGYSLNALLKREYFTIHVTPQSECSYVSFETNIVLSDYEPLIQKVLSVFQPRRFTLVFICKDLNFSCFDGNGAYRQTWNEKTSLGGGYSIYFSNFQTTAIPLETMAEIHLKKSISR